MPTLKLDTVQGHEVLDGFRRGQIVRKGKVLFTPGELNPFSTTEGSPTVLTRAINIGGMPFKGDPYPDPRYSSYFLKTFRANAVSATIVEIDLIYEYQGQIIIRDTSSLTGVEVQLHPSDGSPMYVKWRSNTAVPATEKVNLASFKSTQPIRYFSFQQTVAFVASPAILSAFGTVNSITWHGLPKGYWLLSGLDAYSDDNGLTWTYQATWSTRCTRDWSEYSPMMNERGLPVLGSDATTVAAVKALYATDYDYGFTMINGITKAGLYPLSDFLALFGVE